MTRENKKIINDFYQNLLRKTKSGEIKWVDNFGGGFFHGPGDLCFYVDFPWPTLFLDSDYKISLPLSYFRRHALRKAILNKKPIVNNNSDIIYLINRQLGFLT